jgi:hypothetical protein
MATPAPGPSAQLTHLPAGQGRVFRRELAARSIVAGAVMLIGVAATTYGAAALAANAGIGLPFLVFGTAAVCTQGVLAAGMVRVRRAIAADTYTTTAVRRARRTVETCLIMLGGGALVALVITAASTTGGLGAATALGIAAVFALAVEQWRVFWRLGSHHLG